MILSHTSSMIASAPSRESLLRVAKTFPAAPRILAQLGKMVRDGRTDLEDVTALLKRDASLTARIIRISNSAVYAHSGALASLEDGVARIGLNEVYRLTALAATAQLTESDLPFYGLTGAQFRENALLTALVMEQLAVPAALDGGAAYTAGLLRSVGKIALDRWVRGPGSTGTHCFTEHGMGDVEAWETGHAGLTGGEAAGFILSDWNFPEATIGAVRDHYRPEPSARLTALLNLAAGAAERCGHGWAGEWSFWEGVPEKLSALGLDQDDLDVATRRALELFGPVRAAVA